MWVDPENLLYGITVNQEDGRVYVRNGHRVYTSHTVLGPRRSVDHQWNNSTATEAAKFMVSKYCNEDKLLDIFVVDAVPFDTGEPLEIVSSMTKSLYALAYYGIAIDDNNHDDFLPLKKSLKVKEKDDSDWIQHCPLLNLTLNKIPTDHPTLNDTFLLASMRMYLANHLNNSNPPARLISILKKLDEYDDLVWSGRGLEKHHGENPTYEMAYRVGVAITRLLEARLFDYGEHSCNVRFDAISQKPFEIRSQGVTIIVIPDTTVMVEFRDSETRTLIADFPLMTMEAKSPGCAISEGAKSMLDSATQRVERKQRDGTRYNDLTQALAWRPGGYRINSDYNESMENARVNFALTLREAVSQAVAAETNMFAAVDGISLTIFEIKDTGAIENDTINMVCNVHHSDVDQKHPGVLLFRAILNKFCYTYGGNSIRREFASWVTGSGRTVPDTEYSQRNRVPLQEEIQQRQRQLKQRYVDYAGDVLQRNVEIACSIPNAIEESWESFAMEEAIQEFDKIGYVGKEGVRAKVYKCRRNISSSTKSSIRVLKLLEPTVNGLELFQNEVNAYKQLQSSEAVASFIPKVYGYGVITNDQDPAKPVWMLFIELELVEGATVTLDSHRDEINEAERLFSDWGVKHNDMHPGNMLFNTASNQLKIFDFGLASCIERDESNGQAKVAANGNGN